MTTLLYPGLNLGARHQEAHAKAETQVFGFWVFLMSDLITFGLFFATYVVMVNGTAGGPGPHELFNLKSVMLQTGFLLASSFTMAMGMLSLKYEDNRNKLLGWLAATGVLGACFIALEVSDFMAAAAKGGVPSRSGFLSAYYGLVGLHGFHVSVGLLWLVTMMVRIATGPLTVNTATRLLRLSLYWHFLDIIWIAVFSVVFLGGMA